MTTLTRERLEQRIRELEDAQKQLLEQANAQLARLQGAIAMCRELIAEMDKSGDEDGGEEEGPAN
ncbi:MAG: hypothetical protein KatS3mg051_1090 [Anaerolineae bacterium]|nr:MAG: hypothetical protein KatS3mg051_1090 [Anaerolineae bacterium]